MSTFMALIVLRQIRDWNPGEDIAAFAGDVERQYNDLFKTFKNDIINSGLFNPSTPSPAEREKWLKGLELLEIKLRPYERHPGVGGNKGTAH